MNVDVRAEPAGDRLSVPTRLLHWGVALGILAMVAFGFWLQTIPEGPGRGAAIRLHKSLGLLLLVLAVARLAWRLWEGALPPVRPARLWERRVATTMHGILIAATVLMPLSGIARSVASPRPLALFEWPLLPKLFAERQEGLYAASAALHDGFGILLPGLIALHVAAALKHQLLDRDATLRRMLGLTRWGRLAR